MKILILRAQNMCHGILECITDNMANALKEKGIEVVFFDIKKEAPQNIVNYISENYLAVIDVYSGMLSIKIDENNYLWDYLGIPIFQICLDYPLYIESILGVHLNRYYPLCMDRYYCEAFQEFYHIKNKPIFFPVTGKISTQRIPWNKRDKNIVFVGAYTDYRPLIEVLDHLDEDTKIIGHNYFDDLIAHPEWNQMKTLEYTLRRMELPCDSENKKSIFMKIGKIAKASMAYYRENVVEELVRNNIEVHVYGDSWKMSPLCKYASLVCHHSVEEDEYIDIMANAKISLNLLYNNKAGYTERFGYSMLNGAISLTDESEYLMENFYDKENICFYQLGQLSSLSEKAQWILSHEEESQRISDRAWKMAMERYQWDNCANQFLENLVFILEE